MKKILPVIRKVHLWTGLIAGVIASFSGITGALYTWQPEITRALNPSILSVSDFDDIYEKDISLGALALFDRHKDSIFVMNLPYRKRQTISIDFKGGQTIYYHPSNGQALGTKTLSIRLFEKLLILHRTLGIPIYGKYIIGWSAVIFGLVLLSSGFYIWWLRYRRKLIKGLVINLRRKKERVNYDLHKVLGIAFLIPMTVLALTGAYFTFPSQYRELVNLLEANPSDTPSASFIRDASNNVRERIRSLDTDYKLRAIVFPKSGDTVHHFRYVQQRPITIGLRRVKEIKVNGNVSTMLLSEFNTDSSGTKFLAQMYPTHTGEIIGLWGRILVFLTGCIPLILLITGVRYYLFRTRSGNG